MDYMETAIALSKKGIGHTRPNPLVGAVIVKNNHILAQGYHAKYGSAHAEINALHAACESVEGATMYVTLEPCSHAGKQPPCAPAIIAAGIHKVVIGALDPNPLVNGAGAALLRQAGMEVVTGYLEKECKRANEVFFKFITTKRPFVVMKAAMTLDGKIASHTGSSKWVTCEKSRQAVHVMRSAYSAVLVGIKTVLADDPALTSRIENGINPIRVIADSRLSLPENAKVLADVPKESCILAVGENVDQRKKERLLSRGVTFITLPPSPTNSGIDLNVLMVELGKMGIDSVLLEGGSKLNASALQAGIVDKLSFFIAPKLLGGERALSPIGGKGIADMEKAIRMYDIEVTQMETDLLVSGYIERSQPCSQES